MALVFADRVRETTSTAGTGTFSLLGAVNSCQSFSAIGNGNTTYYTAVSQTGTEWEVGLGTYNAGTITRDTILASSNGGAIVNFSAGTKDIFCDYPAGKAVLVDGSGNTYAPNIGGTTASAGTFTTLTATGTTNLGGASGSSMVLVSPKSTNLGQFQAAGGTYTQEGYFGYTNNSTYAALRFNATPSTGGAGFFFSTYGSPSNSGSTQFAINHTSSAVNYVQVTGGATTVAPTISAQGSDANVTLRLIGKGSGTVDLGGNGNPYAFQVVPIASGSNYNGWKATSAIGGSAAGSTPVLSTWGIDTNIALALQSKGTGGIDLAAGSAGVNISNGGTVTAITRTSAGSLYTSIPTVVVSAPTTSGGVQAVLQLRMAMGSVSLTITSGGSGYTVNDILTLSGGTFTSAAQLRVTTVSAGVITGVVRNDPNWGDYTALPTSPVSVTGGTGTGATFTPTWEILSFNITTAGSGYVEQPTVTFSGGGGSGAAAFATVGSGTLVRTLGTNLGFYTPGGQQLLVGDTYTGGLATNYIYVRGRGAGAAPIITGSGEVNTGINIAASGTGTIGFQTSNGGSPQAAITHTASSVNFVQLTGAATGVAPVISSQGSDTNISTRVASKGSEFILFSTNYAGSGTGNLQVAVAHTASAVNYLQFTGAATLSPVQIQAQGSDGNIGIQLKAKGSSAISFWSGGGSYQQFRISNANNAVNNLAVAGTTAGNSPILSVEGTDTNINLNLVPKGTGNVQQNGVNLALSTHKYHAFTVGTYYFDNYEQPNYFRLFTQNATTDTIRYKTVTSPEYYNYGTSTWTAWAAGQSGIQSLLDGNPSTGIDVAHANRTFRFILSGVDGWPTNALVMLQTTWSAVAYTTATVTIATSTVIGGPFTSRQVMVFSSANSGNNWGMHSYYTGSIHTGDTFYQITIDLTDWVDVSTYTTYPLRNLSIFSNYSTAGGIVPYTTTFDKNASFIGGITTATDANSTFGIGRYNSSDTNAYLDAIGSAGAMFQRVNYLPVTRLSYTASSVNYLQFAGSTTGNTPIISAQGSDTNIGMAYITKGTGSHYFYGPALPSFVVNSQTSNANYGAFTSTSAGTSPLLQIIGTDTNIDFRMRTQGTGGYQLDTGTNGNTQLKVVNIASAVNFVQIVGAASLAGAPSVSFTGSDASVGGFIVTKGGGGFSVTSQGGANRQFRVDGGTAAVNYLQIQGSVAGSAPILSAQGSDTDVDLILGPKGAGRVQYGTYTGTVLAITGYIEIKDSGGTVRRLAVVA